MFRYSIWVIAAAEAAVQIPVSVIPRVVPDTRGQPYGISLMPPHYFES